MKLRPATENDIAQITAIYGASVLSETASFEYDPPSEAEMLQRFQTITEGGFPYLVAERDGEILGYAYAGAYHKRFAYRFTVENSVYISKNAQRMGLGKKLTQAVIDACIAKGYRQMIAVITGGPNSASAKMHAALGFAPVGTIEAAGWKHDQWLGVTYMQLPLGDGATTPPA